MYLEHEHEQDSVTRLHGQSHCDEVILADCIHALHTYDVDADIDDAAGDTDGDVGPRETS